MDQIHPTVQCTLYRAYRRESITVHSGNSLRGLPAAILNILRTLKSCC